MRAQAMSLALLGLALLSAGPAAGKAKAGSNADAALAVLEDRRPWAEPLSYTPRSFLYHNFISDAEADHIIRVARPFMKRSTVVGAKGDSVVDNYRTSYGTFIRRMRDPTITGIQERIAMWTAINMTHQEDMQVLRYGYSQQYKAHYDSLDEESPRTATVLMYLSDVEEGGETTFPQGSEWITPELGKKMEAQGFSKCAAGHVSMKPKKGDALVFWSVRPDGKTFDPAALHTACPVIKGVKWVGIYWIHTEPFRPHQLLEPVPEEKQQIFPEDCEDTHEHCGDWAASGQCENNRGFMLGDVGSLGACRAACGECEVCSPDDLVCKNRNRERAGYLPLTPGGDPAA